MPDACIFSIIAICFSLIDYKNYFQQSLKYIDINEVIPDGKRHGESMPLVDGRGLSIKLCCNMMIVVKCICDTVKVHIGVDLVLFFSLYFCNEFCSK